MLNNNNKEILIFTMTAYLMTALAAAPVSDQIVDILCRAEKMSMSEKGHITASTKFGLNIALILSTYTAHIQ